MAFKPLEITTGGSTTITQVIEELLKFQTFSAQKVVSLIIVMGIEVSILFLAVFAAINSRNENQGNLKYDKKLGKINDHPDNGKPLHDHPELHKSGLKGGFYSHKNSHPECVSIDRWCANVGGSDKNSVVCDNNVKNRHKSCEKKNEVMDNNEMIKDLQAKFGEKSIIKFFEKVIPVYQQTGKLPSTNQLSKNFREIKKFILKNLENRWLLTDLFKDFVSSSIKI